MALCASPAADRTVLRGHVPPLTKGREPVGQPDPDEVLNLAVGIVPRDPEGLKTLLKELYDPQSPHFRQWLTTAEFTERFGPTTADYRSAMNYFKTNGLEITGTFSNRLVLDVKGPVSAIEAVFQTRLRLYAHPTEHRLFRAPDREPSVPAGLAIRDVSGLDNAVLPRPKSLHRKPAGSGVIQNATGSGPGGDFMGKDFRAAYAPGVALTGVGQVIGLFEFGPYFANDIPVYEQAAGLPTSIVVTNILLDGFTGVPAAGADDGEQALDIEVAMNMAPGAIIAVYEGNNAYDIINRMASDNWAKQIGCSWGFLPAPSGMDTIFQQMAAQGQSYFDAAGDGGAYTASSTIYAPTDDPYITSVGGTSLTTSGPSGPWLSETTWSGSGGGVSQSYAIPTWQQGVSMTANHGSTTQRNFPDVAMLADTVIFWVYDNGQTGTVGGTSAAAPGWAGFMALVNQQAVANGRATIGSLNSTIYSIGQSAAYNQCFHDITTGNNFNTASPANYSAVTGYDLCTGWGTPGGSNLINALAGPTDPLRVSPGLGFVAVTPFGIPFSPTNVVFALTNGGASPLNWTIGSTSLWLNVSATTGTLAAAGPATGVTVTFNPAGMTNTAVGSYYANLWFTNTSSGVVQSRLFTLMISGANWPLAVTGFNASLVVPNTATAAAPQATGFDIANRYAFYEAGLAGGGKGFPASGTFISAADNQTVFQFGPYGSPDALQMGDTFPASRTLSLSSPQSYDSLAVLAASANGGGNGALVVNFSDGSHSSGFSFNDQDWFNTTANVAIQGFGRVQLGGSFSFEDPGSSNPNLYQTILNLAALGLNQPVSSITFTNPAVGGNQDSAVFAVSGVRMAPQVIITGQPQPATNDLPAQPATLSVTAMGAPPLGWQWYFSASGNPGTYQPLANQTKATLSVYPAQTSNDGSYYVVVTNAYNAATSVTATLSVFRAPVIVQQPTPTNASLFAGESLTLTTVVDAALPVSYTWYHNSTNLLPATAASCALSALQLTNSGTYTVVATNLFGSATSAPATLTVVPAPADPYGQVVLAAHPLGFWRLDEGSGSVAHDYIAARNGIYRSVLLGQPGYSLIDTQTVARFGYLATTYSCVSNGTGIDFSTSGNAAFSVEAWVFGGPQGNDNGVIAKGTGGGGEQFNLDCGGNNHAFRFFVRDAGGGAHLANSSVTPASRWLHLVGVCDEANSNVVLYINGTNAAQGTISPGSGILSTTNPVAFGCRQSGATAYDLQFAGFMEDVAIYKSVLSAATVQGHFGAATNRPPYFFTTPFAVAPAVAGQAYTGSIATNAASPNGNALTFALVSGPAWLSVAANGALYGSPANGNWGWNTFEVSVRDAHFTTTGTLWVYVEAVPAFTNSPILLPPATAGQPYSASLAGAAVDPDGSSLIYTLAGGPAWLAMDLTGSFTGIPGPGDVASDTFSVTATAPNGLAATAAVDLTVQASPGIVASLAWQNSALLLSWLGGAPPYQIQYSPDLSPTNWQTVAAGLATNTQPFAPTNPAGYYRVVGQ